MENGGRRRDRIATEEHLHVRQLATRDEAISDSIRTGDGTIKAWLHRRCTHMALRNSDHTRLTDFGRFAISMARVERGNVRIRQNRVLGELILQPVDDRLAVTVKHPKRQAQRPHVLAAQRLFIAKPERLYGIQRQLRDVELNELPLTEAVILKRIGVILRLGKVTRRELTAIRDDEPPGLQILDVRLKRRGVHRDEHIGCIACGLDFAGTEVDLKCGNPEQRAQRRTDFSRKIRERRKIIASQRGRQCELPTGQLHPVTRVARKADNNGFRALKGRCVIRCVNARGGGHVLRILQGSVWLPLCSYSAETKIGKLSRRAVVLCG